MPECAVYGCKPEPGASFYDLPKDWIQFIHRHCGHTPKDVKVTRVCSGHFNQESFINCMKMSVGFTKRLILSPDAGPRISVGTPAASGTQHSVEMDQDQDQDQDKGRKEVGCQWESPRGEIREERREVGCQSESAESRDVAVQVDISSPTGVWNAPWQCVSVRADEQGGGALLHSCTGPLLYPTSHLQQLHLASLLPSMPLYQSLPLFLQGASPLQQNLSLPSMPMRNAPPPVGVQHDVSPPVTPADIEGPPPGLIAPLSPRLAEDEDEEEGSLLNQGKGVSKCSSVTSEKKKRTSVCRKKSQPVPNTTKWKKTPSSTVRQKRSSNKKEDYSQHVLHPVERSCDSKTVQSVAHTPVDGGEEEVKEEGGAVKPVKQETKKTELAGRPRRSMVRPPVRYLMESELRSYSLTTASGEKVKRKMEKHRREEERGVVELTERTDSSRLETSNDGAVGGWHQPCQVCGLVFTKEASLQLHLSVHRTGRKFSCLGVHNYCHYRGNRDGVQGKKDGHRDNKATATASNHKEMEANTDSDGGNNREKRSEEEDKKPLLPQPTMASDWSSHRNCNRWSGFRTQMKRREENREKWRRLQENDGEEERKRKRRREEEEENKEVKRICVKFEAGGEEQEAEVKVGAGGEDVERRRDGGEEEEEARTEVMEPPQRLRRRMVGPPIRYLLESEEKSDGPVKANQERRKPQKKKKAGGGASDNTIMIDRSVDIERQTGRTNQDAENIPKQKRGRPNKVELASKRQTDHMVSERETGHIYLERQTDHVTSERQTGHRASERETGHMASQDTVSTQKRRERPKKVIIDSRAGGVASHRQTGRQTGDIVSERQTVHMETERQTESQVTGNKASEGETSHTVSERQTGAKKTYFVFYRDVQNGQLTVFPPCCVRLQRLF